MKKQATALLVLLLFVYLVGCATTEKSRVTIQRFYDEPDSINSKDTIILEGVLEGEFLEVVIYGEIENFEHVRLEYDERKNELIEKEILNKFDRLNNQTIIIKTYMRCLSSKLS